MINLNEVVEIWVENQHIYKTKFSSRPVDFVQSKLFNTIDFYFINEEDEQWYLDLKKEEYKQWCEDEEREFDNNRMYSTFISELSVSADMVDKMLAGNNPKRIKKKYR